jgi:glutamate/tyrosine decarboxylase-like PLP-dependent enzyme
VNVVSEEQERQVALLGLEVNLADASVYPASMDIHDQAVAAIARLWHAPCPNAAAAGANNSNHVSASDYSGAGTVGSTEACLLGMYCIYIYIYIIYITSYSHLD